MSFQQKLVGSGGACKNKKLFCHYCACHGDHDLFTYVTGDERCKICKFNGREKCAHADWEVNDPSEIERKGRALIEDMVDNFKLQTRSMIPLYNQKIWIYLICKS